MEEPRQESGSAGPPEQESTAPLWVDGQWWQSLVGHGEQSDGGDAARVVSAPPAGRPAVTDAEPEPAADSDVETAAHGQPALSSEEPVEPVERSTAERVEPVERAEPVRLEPADPRPVESGPVESEPGESGPVEPEPAETGLVEPEPEPEREPALPDDGHLIWRSIRFLDDAPPASLLTVGDRLEPASRQPSAESDAPEVDRQMPGRPDPASDPDGTPDPGPDVSQPDREAVAPNSLALAPLPDPPTSPAPAPPTEGLPVAPALPRTGTAAAGGPVKLPAAGGSATQRRPRRGPSGSQLAGRLADVALLLLSVAVVVLVYVALRR